MKQRFRNLFWNADTNYWENSNTILSFLTFCFHLINTLVSPVVLFSCKMKRFHLLKWHWLLYGGQCSRFSLMTRVFLLIAHQNFHRCSELSVTSEHRQPPSSEINTWNHWLNCCCLPQNSTDFEKTGTYNWTIQEKCSAASKNVCPWCHPTSP